MAEKFYGDRPRSSYLDLARQEEQRIAEYTRRADRDFNRRRMMGGGEYDELYPGLTDEDAAAVQRDAALGTLEVPMTIGSSILADIPAGWAGINALGPEKTRIKETGEDVLAEQQLDPVTEIERYQEALTYMPRSESGKRALESIGNALQTILSPATRATDAIIQTGMENDIPIPGIAIPLTAVTALAEAVPGRRPASATARAAERTSGRFVKMAEETADNLNVDELGEMAQIAAQRDPNVTIAAQAAEAGAPIPEANPAIRNDLPELDQPAGAGLDQIDSRLDELYAEYDELLQNKPQGRDGDYEMDRLEELRNEIDDLEQMREGAGAIPANDEVFDWNAGNARPRGGGGGGPVNPADKWTSRNKFTYEAFEDLSQAEQKWAVDNFGEEARFREYPRSTENGRLQLSDEVYGPVAAETLGLTGPGRSQRGAVENTGAGQQVLATQAGRNIITNAMNMDESRVAQRFPTAVKATDNALNNPDLMVDIQSMSPEQMEKAMNAMREYPQYRNLPADPYEAAGQVTQLHRRNLEWLMENVPKEILDRSSKWYEGAQRIAFDLSDTYRYSPEQAAGVLAVMSPKTEWFTNVSSAERIMRIAADGDNLKWDKRVAEALDRFAPNINNKKFKDEIAAVRGKNYADLETPEQKALFIRAYDEAYNTRGFSLVTPEGERYGLVATGQGAEAKFGGWGVGMGPIAKAVEILETGDLPTISTKLGTNHKIRNFYNNIIAPHSKKGDTTIDTHAVSANMLSPYGQKDLPVLHAFGSSEVGGPGAGGSSLTGIQGTYAIQAEPYRQIGNAMNIPARAVQSMTWEAVRGLFTNKSKKVKDEAERVWRQYSGGYISEGEARQKIMELAGGIELPAWAKR